MYSPFQLRMPLEPMAPVGVLPLLHIVTVVQIDAPRCGGTIGWALLDTPPNPRRWAWRCHKRRSWEVGWVSPNWVQQQGTAIRKPIWVPRRQHPREYGDVVVYAQGPNGSHQSRLLTGFLMPALMQNESINTAIRITKKTDLRLFRLEEFKTITTNQNTRARLLAGQFD
jgi:hypothetical protein